jgi:hypothetical protein
VPIGEHRGRDRERPRSRRDLKPLPLNTYGGQLSAGRLHGYWLLHEACLQIRGQASPRQVPGADVAVAAAGAGPLGGCLLLTR